MINTYGRVTFSKVATLLKVTLAHGCFSRFLNCTSGIKPRKASQILLYNPSMFYRWQIHIDQFTVSRVFSTSSEGRVASSWKILEKKLVMGSPGKTQILAKVLEKAERVMVKYFVCLSSVNANLPSEQGNDKFLLPLYCNCFILWWTFITVC